MDWWEGVKKDIKALARHAGILRARERRQDIRRLQTKYRILQGEEKLNPGSYIDRINGLKRQIKDLQLNCINGVKIRSEAKYLDNGERPTGYFLSGKIKGQRSNV